MYLRTVCSSWYLLIVISMIALLGNSCSKKWQFNRDDYYGARDACLSEWLAADLPAWQIDKGVDFHACLEMWKKEMWPETFWRHAAEQVDIRSIPLLIEEGGLNDPVYCVRAVVKTPTGLMAISGSIRDSADPVEIETALIDSVVLDNFLFIADSSYRVFDSVYHLGQGVVYDGIFVFIEVDVPRKNNLVAIDDAVLLPDERLSGFYRDVEDFFSEVR